MTSRLDRILDGLEVTLDRRALAGNDTGLLELACGTLIHVSRSQLIIAPPPHRLGLAPSSGSRIRVSYRGVVDLFEQLDRPLLISVGADELLRHCAEQLVEELASQRPGRCAMAAALLRQLLILTLRRRFDDGRDGEAWLVAVDDPGLGRALAAMRAHPDHTFSVGELAELAAMSRTVFASRFVEAFAQPPFEFLTRLRLERAAQLLSSTELPVKSVAAHVGYSSRSSFTRAFLATYGAAPKTFRRDTPRLSA